MSERTSVGSKTPEPKASKPAAGSFEMPKFEIQKFEVPNVEMPAAFREFAERGVAQAKDTYEKMRAAAEEATEAIETSYSTASKGASDYGLKVIQVARINTEATFDFASRLSAAKTLTEVVEVSNAHARQQFEALAQQAKELNALAQKLAPQAAEPIKSGMNKTLNKSVIDLTAEELGELAREAWSGAAREALAKGLSVTGSHDGRRYRYHPDGRIEDLGPVADLAAPTTKANVADKKSTAA